MSIQTFGGLVIGISFGLLPVYMFSASILFLLGALLIKRV